MLYTHIGEGGLTYSTTISASLPTVLIGICEPAQR